MMCEQSTHRALYAEVEMEVWAMCQSRFEKSLRSKFR